MSDTSIRARAGLWTAPGVLARLLADGRLECLACAHRCALGDGQTGRCGVRHREGDQLLVPAGYVAARARGLATVVVSDGNTTPEALGYLRPAADVYRVDLKAFTDTQYARVGGRLSTVLAAIKTARALGYWVEVVTLVVPEFNDDLAGLRTLARALAGIDPGTPWHLNAFQPRYRWRDRPPQSAPLLVAAAGSAYARGLRHVYVGNVTHAAPAFEQTRCPACHAVVITRQNYRVLNTRLVDGRCPDCGSPVGGLWMRPARVAAA
jgi:pyruvate formate lyase activating enzyme